MEAKSPVTPVLVQSKNKSKNIPRGIFLNGFPFAGTQKFVNRIGQEELYFFLQIIKVTGMIYELKKLCFLGNLV